MSSFDRLAFLRSLCVGCESGFCFFSELVSSAGGVHVREPSGQFDATLCPALEAVAFRTPLTDEQILRRRMMSEVRYRLGLNYNRPPCWEEVIQCWDARYESSFIEAYHAGTRTVSAFRQALFGL